MRGQWAIAVAALLSAGCATIPDVRVGYRLPRADMAITVTRTIGCGPLPEAKPGAPPPQPRALYVVTTVVPNVTYSADTSSAARVSFNLAAMNSPLSDSGITFELYDDGRLKAVNSATTGQGQAVVQAVAALLPLAASQTDVAPDAGTTLDTDAICGKFDRVSPDGKPVSMIYEFTEDFQQRREVQPPDDVAAQNCDDGALEPCHVARSRMLRLTDRLLPIVGRRVAIQDLNDVLPRFCLVFGDPERLQPVGEWDGASGDGLPLRLRAPVQYTPRIHQIAPGAAEADADCNKTMPDNSRLWQGRTLIPLVAAAYSIEFPGQTGEYVLPVPRGAPFGNNSLKLGLAESGAITTLGYGSTSGMAGAIGSIGAIGAAMTDTDAERAAAYDSQADVIAQQQRLIRCQQTPTSCTP